MVSRRLFLFGAGAGLIAAPAIVRAASLMPVRGIVMDSGLTIEGALISYRYEWMAIYEERMSLLRTLTWAEPTYDESLSAVS